MFGYATNETEQLMPLPLELSHAILSWLTDRRKGGERSLRPDAKSQVTVRYEGGKPVSVSTIVVSHQHAPGTQKAVAELIHAAIEACVPAKYRNADLKVLVNPSGSFEVGGPAADTGLTGRKIIVDTYGGAAPHGGGAFSGKDPTKVDRAAAYAARWLAKNIVAANIADRCLIQVAYVIGVAKPVSLAVETFGTSPELAWTLQRAIERCVDLTPRGIRERLQLARPIYSSTASGGHFGRTPRDTGEFSWERTDLVEELLAALP
jgi:S-adenosylmethionine synthetase